MRKPRLFGSKGSELSRTGGPLRARRRFLAWTGDGFFIQRPRRDSVGIDS